MPKCGQMRVGASWVGGKEPDLLAPGRLRFYDKRCRTRIMLGAVVRGKIGKNSIWRVRHGSGANNSPTNIAYQEHFKYYDNKGAPGSDLENWQAIFKSIMDEVKLMPPATREVYKAMEVANRENAWKKPGSYKARSWPHFYISVRLKELYPGYP